MGVEYERKYAATPQILAAVEKDLPLQFQSTQMRTTYYDTPTGELSKKRMTLRLRQENDTTVCTFKSGVSHCLRNEWECVCADIRQGIEKLCQLGAPEMLLGLAGSVVPVCGASFVRRWAQIRYVDACLELALDDGKLLGGGREVPLCELEVELKQGDAGAVEQFAAELCRRYGLLPEPESKFSRAMALARGDEDGL